MQDGIHDERVSEKEVRPTVFLCGPNRECQHDMSGWQDIVENGRVCGGTAVCLKCGETSFNLSIWS